MNTSPASSLLVTPSTDPRGRSLNDPLFQNAAGRSSNVPVTSNSRDFIFRASSQLTQPARQISDYYTTNRYTPVSPLDKNAPAEYSSPVPKAVAVSKSLIPPPQKAPEISVNTINYSPGVNTLNAANIAALRSKSFVNNYTPVNPNFYDPSVLVTSDTGVVNNFFNNLGTWQGSIPLQHFWVVQFKFQEDFFTTFADWTKILKSSGEGCPWNQFKMEDIKSVISSKNFQGKDINQSSSLYTGCYFARSVSIPGERTNTLNPSIPAAGGLYFSNITNKREAPTNLQISFMETNVSFVDLFIRPWSILSSYLGTIGRNTTEENNNGTLKVDVEATFFAKNQFSSATDNGFIKNNSINSNKRPYEQKTVSTLADIKDTQPVPRKKFTFKAAMPLSVNNQEYTYVGEALQIRPVDFIYSSYKVDTYT